MEEPRWYNNAEEYRLIQGLVRDGRHQEAVERVRLTLAAGQLGRRNAARLHALVCRLYVEELRQPCPAAVLHGEEAVRLAELVGDPWLKCEALSRLAHTYYHMGDLDRAGEACTMLAIEVDQNPAVIPGGPAVVLLLQALLAAGREEWHAALAALEEAEAHVGPDTPDLLVQVRLCRAGALLETDRHAEAALVLERVMPGPEPGTPLGCAVLLARAWLALAETDLGQVDSLLARLTLVGQASLPSDVQVQVLAVQALLAELRRPPEAAALAKQAYQRALRLGRTDLARQCRRRLAHLLPVTGSTTA